MSYKRRDRADLRRLYKTLIEEFGQEKGQRIIEVLTMELGGRRVTIPGHRALARDHRARRIQELYDIGLTASVLARRFGISLRQVKYDLKRELLTESDGTDMAGHIAGREASGERSRYVV